MLGTADGRLVSVDAATGEPASGFGNNGQVDLVAGLRRNQRREEYGVNSPPIVVGDVVVVGSNVSGLARFRGSGVEGGFFVLECPEI